MRGAIALQADVPRHVTATACNGTAPARLAMLLVASPVWQEPQVGSVSPGTRGVLALQLHAGPPMMAQFKNIRIKKL